LRWIISPPGQGPATAFGNGLPCSGEACPELIYDHFDALLRLYETLPLRTFCPLSTGRIAIRPTRGYGRSVSRIHCPNFIHPLRPYETPVLFTGRTAVRPLYHGETRVS